MDYTTALYYTFSTIPQTLAGLLGLLGAFILFRLQQLSESSSQSLEKIDQDVPQDRAESHEEFHKAFRNHDTESCLSLIDQGKIKFGTSDHREQHHIESLKKKLKQIKGLRQTMRILMIFGALIVAASLTVLAFAPCIGGNEGLIIALMVSGVIITPVYIFMTFFLLLRTAV
jgi:ABC-type nickel/cobalt efflux system permease component RcnA